MKKTDAPQAATPSLAHILAMAGADIQNMRPFLPPDKNPQNKQ